MKLRVIVRRIREHHYIASCPNLPGCHVEAESQEKAEALLKAALKAYLSSYRQRHEKLPYIQD